MENAGDNALKIRFTSGTVKQIMLIKDKFYCRVFGVHFVVSTIR